MVKFQEYAKAEMINGVRTYTTEILEGSKYDRTGGSLKFQQVCELRGLERTYG